MADVATLQLENRSKFLLRVRCFLRSRQMMVRVEVPKPALYYFMYLACSTFNYYESDFIFMLTKLCNAHKLVVFCLQLYHCISSQ